MIRNILGSSSKPPKYFGVDSEEISTQEYFLNLKKMNFDK